MKLKDRQMQYFETALWSSGDEFDEFSITDIAEESIIKGVKELEDFLDDEVMDLVGDSDLTTVAHDFWLTRCGHGAGFWDGDYEHGDRLTELCEKFKSLDLVLGDDNKIHMEG